jgi:Immunity protein Imm1
MTTAEQIEHVAHLNWAKRLGPPTLQRSEAEPAVTILTCLDLDQALHKIAMRKPPLHPIIAILYGHGCQVGIGLGLQHSFVSIYSGDPRRPQSCVITVADVPPRQDAVFYLLDTHRTEIQRRHLIPATQARQIVRDFLKTGCRSTTVRWEEL